ncbi:hypothetical protein OIU78_018479 [Salix suchowensis]|nr:hypothetical protein OIU78_018479 [Salix suchowensis]
MIWASVGGVGGIKRAESELFGLFFDVFEMVVMVSGGFGEGSGAFEEEEEEEVVGFLDFEPVVVMMEEEEVVVLVGEEVGLNKAWSDFIARESKKANGLIN